MDNIHKLPWEACGNLVRTARTDENAAGWFVCDTGTYLPGAIERAAFIVRAANSHAALVSALEDVIRVADRATVEFDNARAALALAKGEQA